MNAAPHRFVAQLERGLMVTVELLCGALLLLMVGFTTYTVVMRYAFRDPPFWGDTLTLFCNIWLALLAYAISVRRRDYVAMQGLYALLPPIGGFLLNLLWDVATAAFAALLVWYGFEAAMNVPGEFWELGGLPKKVPLMIMPVAGVLIALAALRNIVEDIGRLQDGSAGERRLDEAGEGV